MEIMIPVWQESTETQLAASDLQGLKGVSVALVDDNYDAEFTDEVANVLEQTYGALVKRLVKPWGSAPSPKTLIEEAAQCRVAVVGIAL
ncbi:MAG: hypothetical protein V4787_02680 [Pseudomonadota bacterium]